jgi:hypothetical protein
MNNSDTFTKEEERYLFSVVQDAVWAHKKATTEEGKS